MQENGKARKTKQPLTGFPIMLLLVKSLGLMFLLIKGFGLEEKELLEFLIHQYKYDLSELQRI